MFSKLIYVSSGWAIVAHRSMVTTSLRVAVWDCRLEQ